MTIKTTDRGVMQKNYNYSVVRGDKYSGGTVIATGGTRPTPSKVWTTTSISQCEISSEVFVTMMNDLDEFTNREDDNLEEWEEGSMKDQENQTLDIRELMSLPLEDRRRILKKAAEDAEEEYSEEGSLRKFQALGEDDFYAETP